MAQRGGTDTPRNFVPDDIVRSGRLFIASMLLLVAAVNAHAQRCPLNETKVQPSTDYETNRQGGAIVLHRKTDLEWQRCSVGQRWDGTTCSGAARRLSWDDAQSFARSDAANGGRWRVPTIAEFMGIVESGCVSPPVNGNIFPGTQADYYWTVASQAGRVTHAWSVQFTEGNVSTNAKNFAYFVRLVRER